MSEPDVPPRRFEQSASHYGAGQRVLSLAGL